jgi:hypothetical protein
VSKAFEIMSTLPTGDSFHKLSEYLLETNVESVIFAPSLLARLPLATDRRTNNGAKKFHS